MTNPASLIGLLHPDGLILKSMIRQHIPRDIAIVIIITLVALAFVGAYCSGIDHLPLVWALRIELQGGTAYGPEMMARFADHFEETFALSGFAYPLPAMWLTLPIVMLPDGLASIIWTMMSLGSVLAGLWLLRMPLPLIFLFGIVHGASLNQVVVLLVGLLLIGVWALEYRRWGILGFITAITILSKPPTTLLLSSFLLLEALRQGAWKPVALWGSLVLGMTFLLEPTWVPQWLAALAHYQEIRQRKIAFEWLPLALLLWWKRYRWDALAVAQCCLFNSGIGYGMSTILLAYTTLRSDIIAWIIVVASWLFVFFGGVIQAHTAIAPRVIVDSCHFIPLLGYALHRMWNDRGMPTGPSHPR